MWSVSLVSAVATGKATQISLPGIKEEKADEKQPKKMAFEVQLTLGSSPFME